MKITVTGFKSLEIQEVVDESYSDIVESAALSGNPLKYCNGTIFSIAGFDPSDEMKTKEGNGHYQFQVVGFATTEKPYTPIIKHEKSNTDIRVFDVSYSGFYNELAKFVKQYIIESNKEECDVCFKVHRKLESGQCCKCGRFHDKKYVCVND